jgi:mycothiol synthase
MAAGSRIIRNFCSADLRQYLRLHVEAESLCHSDDALFFASLEGSPSKPVNFSQEDIFLAEEKGRISGACRVVPEAAIDRALLRLLIMPGFAEREVAEELLFAAIQRTSRLELLKAHADLREQDRATCDLFAGLGFKPVRRYSQMTLNLERASVVRSVRNNLSLHSLERGQESEFTRLQNHVFQGSWGFCPNTKAEIIQLLEIKGYGHNGVIIAYQGDRVIGYCWTAMTTEPGKSASNIGRIHMFGVVPEFRGQGLAKHILAAGLKHLAESGINTVELTVDNENMPACSLYKKAGFQLKTGLVWYEKQTV